MPAAPRRRISRPSKAVLNFTKDPGRRERSRRPGSFLGGWRALWPFRPLAGRLHSAQICPDPWASKSQFPAFPSAMLIDAGALRAGLNAMAMATPDNAGLRKEGLGLIKTAFAEARARVRHAVEREGLPGLAAARALSGLQDAIIQVIYDFADQACLLRAEPDQRRAHRRGGDRRLWPRRAGAGLRHRSAVPAPLQADRLGRERHRIHSLHAVGPGPEGRPRHALAGRMRAAGQAGHHHPHRDPGSALSVGRQRALRRAAQEILDRGRHRHRPGFRRSQAGRARRSATRARAKAAIWSSPTSRKARAACATCRRSTGSANISITSRTPPTWSSTTSSPARNTRPSRRPKPFCGMCACICIICVGRAEERLSFDVQPELAAALGYHRCEKPRRAVEAFMRAYFLVAKDVGDLTRIFCAALEEQNRKPRPSLRRMLPGFLKPRSRRRRFLCRERPAERRSRHLPPRSGQSSCASSRSPTPRAWTSIPMRCAPSPARSI